ncbi:MAG: molybdopterin-dependent oxidoreductase, partial [Actinomycetota bacterium]|nr:molybdopterin-dependent oxidoreductase [Actinomycetota bacterium]
LARAGGRTGAIVGGQSTNEEGYLLARMLREGLGSPHLDSRVAGTLPLGLHRALGDPRLQAKVSDLEFAHAVLLLELEPLTDAPILDLRLRKGVRRHGMKLLRAHAAELSAPGQLAEQLSEQGKEIVVLWGERLTAGPDGADRAHALLELAGLLSVAETAGAGLLEIPAGTNGRGLREAGALPNAGPGLSDPSEVGRDAQAIAEGVLEGELQALYLMGADPLLLEPASTTWPLALGQAGTVIAHALFLSDGISQHADVVFPSESYAEKEGTITHPDGRVQRLRPAVAHPGSTRSEALLLGELSARLGLDLGVLTATMASQQLFDAVGFYAGLTLEEIGGKGVRWQERESAGAYPGQGLAA